MTGPPTTGSYTCDLLPSQASFFRATLADPDPYQVALRLQFRKGVEAADVAAAVERLWERHDALRSRVVREGDRLRLLVPAAPAVDCPIEVVEVEAGSHEAEARRIEEDIARCRQSIAVLAGRSFAVRIYRRRWGPLTAFLVLHHTLTDGTGVRVLLRDLQGLLRQRRGERALLRAPTSSIGQIAAALDRYRHSDAAREHAATWSEILRAPAAEPVPDHDQGPNSVASARELYFDPGTETARKLLASPLMRLPTSARLTMAAALAQALAATLGAPEVRFSFLGWSRRVLPEVQVQRTVAYLTPMFPVRVRAGRTVTESMERAQDALAAVPAHGALYEALRYGDAPRFDTVQAAARPSVLLHFVGDQNGRNPEALFTVEPDPGDLSCSPAPRICLLIVTVHVAEEGVLLGVEYSPNRSRATTASALGERMVATLQAWAGSGT